MNPKRNKLKSITFANLLVFWCMTVGTGYAQETIDEVTNDSDVVQEAINEAFGLEQKKAEVVAEADKKTEEVVTETEEVEPAEDAAVEAVVVPVKPAKPLTEQEKSVIARRTKAKINGYDAFEAATKAEADGEYQKAISLYEKSINELETVSKNDQLVLAKINDAEVAQGRVNALWAEELAAEADEKVTLNLYKDAISKLTIAQSKNPAKTKEYQERIDELKELEAKATYIGEIKVKNIDPKKADRDLQVKTLLEQGKIHLRNNRIAEAIYSFDGVRRIDPLNKQAYKYLTQAQDKLEEFAKEYKKLSRDRYSNMVNDAWTNPLARIDTIGDPETGIQKKVDEADPNYAKMNDKLDSIIIKKLDLNEATITEVVNLLIDKSRLYDKKYNEGVNIILSQSGTGSSSAPATEEVEDDMGEDADLDDLDMDIDDDSGFEDDGDMSLESDGPSLEEITVSLKFNDMPLRDVIQYVCDAANLQWRVDKFAVKIAKELPLSEKPVTKFFKVRASFIQAMLGAIGGGSGGGGGDEYDDYGDEPSSGSSSVTASSEDLKKAFTEYGVEFLKGTTISYNAHISKLAVKNSEENLVRIQKIINEFDTGRDLINIQSKFVEVSQNDISELGFEWMITDTREFGSGNGSVVIPGTVSDPNDITSGLSKLSDFLSEDQLAPGAGTVLESFITIGNTEFKNVIRALDKKQNADVLSSPEITTLSGEEAEIKSTITRYFPENWTEPEAGDGGSSGSDEDGNFTGVTNSTPSIPEFGEPTELGVVLIVTPTSATGSKEIELTLAPSVKSFVGYDEEIKIPFPGSEPYSPKMAITEERSLKTKVVCDDGETVVLGGLMKEKVTSYEDEVPGLASIPFIGKLFKSEGEFSEKSNLLIFVTASILDTAGRRRRNIGSEGTTGDRGHALRK